MDDAPDQTSTQTATSLVQGKYTVQTRQSGTPEGGVAVARVLILDSEAEADDFTLVADARIERATGSAAIQVRFRYRPEAGGGTGYILTVEPFEGRARLIDFDEGRQQPITGWVARPSLQANFDTFRLMIHAVGPLIVVRVNSEELFQIEDARYAAGVLTVGVVTFSAPVAASFDNVIVTAPSR